MANLVKNDDNTPTKSKSIVLGVIGNLATDLLKGVPYMISSLAGYLAYWRNLDWYWIALIVLGVLGVSMFIVRTVFWLKDRLSSSNDSEVVPVISITTIESEAEIRLGAQIKLLQGDLKAREDRIKNQDAELLEERKQLKTVQEQLDGEKRIVEARDKELGGVKQTLAYLGEIDREKDDIISANDWLIKLAQNQRENIDNYVKLDNFVYVQIDTDAVPLIVFGFRISNKSLFLITLDDTIGGEIEFRTKPLLGEKRFSPPPYPIPPNAFQSFAFKYYVTRDMVNYITKNGYIVESDFNISKLVLTLKGASTNDGIESKPLIVPAQMKVWEYKEYAEAIEKYN